MEQNKFPIYKKHSALALACCIALFPSSYYVFKNYNDISFIIALCIFSISWFGLGYFGGLNYANR